MRCSKKMYYLVVLKLFKCIGQANYVFSRPTSILVLKDVNASAQELAYICPYIYYLKKYP